jgi:hypothetical protein
VVRGRTGSLAASGSSVSDLVKNETGSCVGGGCGSAEGSPLGIIAAGMVQCVSYDQPVTSVLRRYGELARSARLPGAPADSRSDVGRPCRSGSMVRAAAGRGCAALSAVVSTAARTDLWLSSWKFSDLRPKPGDGARAASFRQEACGSFFSLSISIASGSAAVGPNAWRLRTKCRTTTGPLLSPSSGLPILPRVPRVPRATAAVSYARAPGAASQLYVNSARFVSSASQRAKKPLSL